MSKYFRFNEPPIELYNAEDIAKIRKYLEQVGELNCSDKQLEVFWDEFSDSWSASWLNVDDVTLSRFSYWLADYEGEE